MAMGQLWVEAIIFPVYKDISQIYNIYNKQKYKTNNIIMHIVF